VKKIAALLLLIVLLPGCFVSYEPVPPEAIYDFKGTWQGTITDSVGGDGQLTVTILYQSTGTYQEAQFGGNWEADFGAKGKSSGILQGTTYDYENLNIFLNPSSAISCSLRPSTVRNSNTVAATYSAVNDVSCLEAGFGQGTFSLTKQ
jgi:hypothetical protein